MNDHPPPRTEQEVRAELSAGIEHRLAELRRFDGRRRLAEFLVFVPLWPAGAALTLAAWHLMPPGVLAACAGVLGVLLSAVALNAFVLLLHEGMHHVLFARPGWNRWASVLLGAPALISFTAYQVMHLRHHHFLGDPRDPDDYANYTDRPARLWAMHLGRLAFGAFLYVLLIPVLAWRFGSRADRRRIAQEYAVLAAVYAVAFLTVPADVLLLGWLAPAVVVAYATNVRGFTQHGIADAADPYLASRTMRPHPLVEFCLLNENYHLEHHLFPEVPSYHLPALHRLVWSRLPRAVTGVSYAAFLARFARALWRLDPTPIGLVRPAAAPNPAEADPENGVRGGA